MSEGEKGGEGEEGKGKEGKGEEGKREGVWKGE